MIIRKSAQEIEKMAAEMSPTRFATRACAIPAASAAWHVSSSRSVSSEISPTGNV